MYEYDDKQLEDEENGKGVAPFTKGYFPGSKDAYKNVGVTIATGVDLGSKTENQLLGMGVSEDLVDKLAPFMGLKGTDAEKNASKLQITEDEARELNECILNDFKSSLERNLEKQYPGQFASVPKEMKTVLLSLKYQYGSVNAYNKDFVEAAMNGDVEQCVYILRNSTQFKSRRNGQADYLQAAAMRDQESDEEERKNEDYQEKEDLKKGLDDEDDLDKDEEDDDLDKDDDDDSDDDDEQDKDIESEHSNSPDNLEENDNIANNEDEDKDNDNDQDSDEEDDKKDKNEDNDSDDNNNNDDDGEDDNDADDDDGNDENDGNDSDDGNDGNDNKGEGVVVVDGGNDGDRWWRLWW